MNEQNGQQVNNETVNQGQVQQPVAQNAPQVPQQTQQVQAVTQVPQSVQQDSFWKRNWKKVAAGGAALLTAAGSALIAWKKGKAAGISVGMQMPNDDGSYNPLDPNN